ncbi:hypothetical protein ACJJTC_017353 [Scirpophaga incertulas]
MVWGDASCDSRGLDAHQLPASVECHSSCVAMLSNYSGALAPVGVHLIENERDSVTGSQHWRVAGQTNRVSVNGVSEIEKSETLEWAGRAFITGPDRQPLFAE